MGGGMRWLKAVILLCLLVSEARPAAAAVRGAAWIVVDARSGRVLSASNPDRPLPPASLTKMVTAQVVAERARPDAVLRISAAAAHAQADRIRWPLGMRFTVDEVLHGLLMESSNGAAIALAEHVAGSPSAFTALMNAKARALGAASSHFLNPHGLDAPGQFASARDLAAIARGLLKVPALAEIVRTGTFTLTWQGGLTTFHNNNRFLASYAGSIGVKPGYTTLAGNCLAAAAERGGKTIVTVVLNSSSVTEDAVTLMNQAFRDLGVAGAPSTTSEPAPEPTETSGLAFDPRPDPHSIIVVAPPEEHEVVPVRDNRVPSPAGVAIVFLVSGFVSVRRRKNGRLRRPSTR